MSEAAEQLEAMAAEAEMHRGNVTEVIKKMETLTSGYGGDVREQTELSIYTAKETSPNQLHFGSSLPLQPSGIKMESGYVSEP